MYLRLSPSKKVDVKRALKDRIEFSDPTAMSSSQSQAAAAMRALATILFVLLLVDPAKAASMQVIDENGKQGIVIDGPIVPGDNDEFLHALEKVRDKSNTIVFLSGAGGNGIAAVLIGDLVRRSGMSTAVLEGNDCASGCAMIWIAGVQRIARKNACIGFHGMYDYASGQPSADANAIAGAHVGLLGLSLDAALWMLSARQLDIHWLTDAAAEKYGINWRHDSDDPGHSCPNERGEARPQAPLPPEAPLPPQAQQPQRLPTATVTGDLHLRQYADPKAPDVIGPDYRIPEGSQVTITQKCEVWTGSGRGARDADNVWCPVQYGKYKGLANAYLLAGSDGRRVACVMYPDAQGCDPAKESHVPAQQQDSREQCKAKAKGARFFCALGGYDPAYCLEYGLRVRQVCEQQ